MFLQIYNMIVVKIFTAEIPVLWARKPRALNVSVNSARQM